MIMSIRDGFEKIKHIGHAATGPLFAPLCVLLAGILGFGLGRVSKLTDARVPVVIENQVFGGANGTLSTQAAALSGAAVPDSAAAPPPTMGGVVGSRQGTKYHYPWCSGVARIKEGNRVWFDSIEAARAAGYAPATNCKGLK